MRMRCIIRNLRRLNSFTVVIVGLTPGDIHLRIRRSEVAPRAMQSEVQHKENALRLIGRRTGLACVQSAASVLASLNSRIEVSSVDHELSRAA
jgi:hypothetical protein